MAPRIDHYTWAGGREALLRFGPDTGPAVVAALPLFEEANRTRTFVVALLRALAARGIAGLLPDVPGQNESVAPIERMTLADMQVALAAVAPARPTYAIGIRSGALLDRRAGHRGRWYLSPQTGDALLRDLHRTWRAAGNSGGIDAMTAEDPVEIAGNRLSGRLLSFLSAAAPCAATDRPVRVVRLASDPAEADRKVDAAPLWRRSEPGDDPALVAMLADDIAAWIAACEA
ncbi:hypothetical protein FHT00_001501 [Sphingomonas insulae]|uniref:Alpha/beta hydrolase n=1 Tax=Sphingomonas insulae TaxID=424800 RepID=A0ABN1HYF8_9SPHN|nr:hypothetical protein [Sphingomonas insulae]NIJ29554.1 hypothetical protein [Sphingomonas insulae]